MSDAKITLSAEDKTRAAFESAKSNLQGLHTSATSVAGALTGLAASLGVAAFASSIKGAIDAADTLNKLSQRTGVATEQLSQLQFAAKLSDVSTESLTLSIKRLNVSIAEGLAGDKAKVEMFRNLGISLKDASGQAKTADKIMLEMAGTFSTAKDGALKTAYAVGLMGKSGDEMIPLLNGGTQALSDMMLKAQKLGLTISTDFAKQAEEFNDNLTIAKASSDKLTIALAGDLVSGLGKAAKAMADAAVEGGKFAAIMAGIQTLITGDDRHKANVEMAESVNLILQTQNALDKFNAKGKDNWTSGDANAVANLKKELALQQERYRLAQNYGKVLDAENAKAQAAAPTQDKNLKTLTTGATAAASEYDALIKRIHERIALSAAELKAGRELTDEEKFESKVIEDMGRAKKALTDAQRANIEARLADSKAASLSVAIQRSELELAKQIAAQRQQMKNADYDQSAAGLRDIEASYAQSLASVKDRVQGLKDEAAALELSGRLNVSLAEATEMVTLARLEEKKAMLVENGEAWNAVQREIAARKELLGLVANSEQGAKFREMWQSIDSTAHDVFVNIFEGGSNVFKKLGQTLKASLLDLLYQMTVKKWIFNIYASVTGGASGVAGAASTGAVQGGGSSMLGSAVGSMFGAGGIGGSLAAGAGWLTGATTLGGSLTAATSLMGTGTLSGMMSGMGMMAGALGPIAIGVALIASMIKSGGGPKTESGYSSRSGLDTSLAGTEYSRAPADGAKAISQGISGTYATLASTLGLAQKTLDVAVFYAMDNAKGGTAQTQLQVASANYNRGDRLGGVENVARGEDALKAAIAEETTRVMYAGLQGSDLAQKFKNYLSEIDIGSAPADLQARIDTVIQTKALGDAYARLGPAYTFVDDKTVEWTAALIEAGGGLEKLTGNLSSYYENFYSAEEKRRNIAVDIKSALAGTGLDFSVEQILGGSRDQFRALVEQAAAMGPAGEKAYLALLSVNGAFASITPTMEEAAAATAATVAEFSGSVFSSMQDNWTKLLKSITDEVKRIRGLWLEDTSQGLPAARENFLATAALAASGGKGAMQAAGDLAGLSQALLNTASAQANSFFELRTLQALAAQTLADTIKPLQRLQGTQYQQLSAALPAFADGGNHRGGWAMVGERGPELAWMPPARIYSAEQTRGMTARDDGTASEIRQLRADNRAQAFSIAQLNARMVKLLERWEIEGMPETRVTT